MVIARSIGRGVREGARRPALAATLWLWNLLLGAIVALPAWTAFGGAFNLSPEADQLLDRFNIRLLVEAFHYDRSSVTAVLSGAFLAAALLGLVGNALLAGGVLDVLTTDDTRSFLHRFMRGAGHFFARFVRLLLAAGVSFLACAFVASLVAAPIGSVMRQADSEVVRLLSYFVIPAAILLLFAFFSLVLDYARVRMVLEGSRGAFKAWFRSLGFVVRHLFGTTVVAASFAAATAVLLVLSVAYQTRAASNTSVLIVLLFLVQQATMFVRFGLRVGSLAAALEFSERLGNRKLQVAQPGVTAAPTDVGGSEEIRLKPDSTGESMSGAPAEQGIAGAPTADGVSAAPAFPASATTDTAAEATIEPGPGHDQNS
jgi:hypothetical protein